jgi:hypothetical protein
MIIISYRKEGLSKSEANKWQWEERVGEGEPLISLN